MPTSSLISLPADFGTQMVAGAKLLVGDMALPLEIVGGIILGVAGIGIAISLLKKLPKATGK
jgi:hypothetical protein